MEALQNLPPIVALVLGLILLVWLVLVFLVPFMIEGIRQSSRKSYEELVEMNQKLDRLGAMLQRAAAAKAGAPPQRAEPRPTQPQEGESRGRREPTISDTAFQQDQRRARREPVIR